MSLLFAYGSCFGFSGLRIGGRTGRPGGRLIPAVAGVEPLAVPFWRGVKLSDIRGEPRLIPPFWVAMIVYGMQLTEKK